MKMKLCDLMRLQHTMRWSIVPTTRTQSVAEHSFNVAMIAGRIARHAPICIDAGVLREAALMHDAPEAILGDMPTPTKSKMRDAGFEPSTIETMVCGPMAKLPIQYNYIIKAADILEGIHFLTNFGAGPRATAVLGQLTRAYDTMIISVRDGMMETMSDDHAGKMALALHLVREEVLSQEWTE